MTRTTAYDQEDTPTGYQQLSLTTAPVTLVPPVDAAGRRPFECEINVEGGSIRYTDDGSAPSTTRGMLYPAGYNKVVGLHDLSVIQLCAVTTATANISYYWEG